MSIYTEEALDEILDQARQLNQKFGQLKSENSVVKQANSLLSKRLGDMERQCWANVQSVLKWWVFLTVFRIRNWKTNC